jgi:hypothetical protein
MVRYHGKCLDCHRAKNTWYHREGSKEKRNAYELLNARNLLYLAAKSRARKKGREFSIELEDVQIPEKCPVTLKPLIPKTPDAPSIDRIDNTRGYIKGNVQVISKRANLAKNSLTIAELERLLGLIRSNMLS